MNLSKINRVIVHGHCHDGMAAAIILYDALGIEPEFILHSTEEYQELQTTKGMLFCDIAPPEDRFKEFVEAGARVLDHHIGVKHIIDEFGENAIFADEKEEPGISGAMLAFRSVWVKSVDDIDPLKYLILSRLAILAGVKDTWQIDSTRWYESGCQECMLTFYSWDHWKAKIDSGDWDFSKEYEVGQMIYDDRMSKVESLADKAFTFEDAGYKVAVFNDPDRYTSEVSEVLRNRGINVIAGFHYTKRPSDENPMVCFAIRTDGSIDAADLARTIPGGGGHTKAAGFSEIIDLKEINAFAAFMDIFEDYINYHKAQ